MSWSHPTWKTKLFWSKKQPSETDCTDWDEKSCQLGHESDINHHIYPQECSSSWLKSIEVHTKWKSGLIDSYVIDQMPWKCVNWGPTGPYKWPIFGQTNDFFYFCKKEDEVHKICFQISQNIFLTWDPLNRLRHFFFDQSGMRSEPLRIGLN